jgi:hypothetical protein
VLFGNGGASTMWIVCLQVMGWVEVGRPGAPGRFVEASSVWAGRRGPTLAGL